MNDSEIRDVAVAVPDYTALFKQLNDNYLSGKTRDHAWRREQLLALERMLVERESDIIAALQADLGKAAMESFTTEISYVKSDAAHCRRNLRRWAKKRRVATPLVGLPGKSWVQPEPLGIVLVIGAWNYPLQLTLAGMAAALAAGNCVIIKPSELAPATSALIAKFIPEYLDSSCVRVVEGAVPEARALLDYPLDHILFTGSSHIGRIVMAAAAKHLTPVTLELGGKSPAIVLPDANLHVTARRLAWGKFTNAGQTCIAPDYIITDAKTEAKLVPLIKACVHEMFGENAEQSDSYGRIVNARHFERVSRLLASGDIAIGGDVNAANHYIAPTVLINVRTDSPVMQEEIFGPVLPIIRADDLEGAIDYVRHKDKPLAAYLFTGSKQSQTQFLEQVICGNACINDVMMFMAVPELPFGGVGTSGMGAYSGKYGFDTFSHLKAIMKRGWWPDLKLRYAPYTAKKFRMIRRIR